MNSATLELIVTLKNTQTTLNKVHYKLTTDEATLADKITTAIKQTLATEGVTANIELELHHGPVMPHHQAGGGLSASEWLETEEISHHRTNSLEVQKESFQHKNSV